MQTRDNFDIRNSHIFRLTGCHDELYDELHDFLAMINSLQPGVAYPYALRTSENLKVF